MFGNEDSLIEITEAVLACDRRKVYNNQGQLTDPYAHFFYGPRAYRLCRSTYSSSEMTRLSSSASSSASSSPVLFGGAQSSQGSQFHQHPQHNHHDQSNEDHGENGIVEPGYNVPARDAALVIQRAYRRYSMVKEFHRIKTERRLSRRINSSIAPDSGSNGCDICMELRDPHTHSHPEHHHHPDTISNHHQSPELEDDFDGGSSLLPQGDDEDTPCTTDIADVEVVVADHAAPANLSHQSTPSYQPSPHHHHLNSSATHHHRSNTYQLNCSGSSSTGSSTSIGSHCTPQQPVMLLSSRSSYSNGIIHHRHLANHIPSSMSNSSNSNSQVFSAQQKSYGSSVQSIVSSSKSSGCSPLANISPNLSTCSSGSSGSSPKCGGGQSNGSNKASPVVVQEEQSEIIRKRLYRVGLNLFNKKPETGINYLVRKKFLEGSAPAVSRFLISRKGLSKQMIGEYLANLQSPFSMACLEHFSSEIDLASLPIDVALRKFQTYLRMPGEAQKIERIMESFSRRYATCNPHLISQFRNGADTVFVLAFAIIMLNTDLHTPHLKQDRRMKLEDFVKNLRGIDDGGDIERDILVGIYERIKTNEFKTGSDHVTQVMKVQQTIVGKKPNLALPHRRLVCYCRLYEVPDIHKKEKSGSHQREVFLFNDVLVLTKIFHKKRNSVTYSFRQSYPLQGITLYLFNNQYYEFGLTLKKEDNVLLSLNARNEHDRAKFAEDLREAIAESDEMMRIETAPKENRDRDSGVDVGKMKRFSNSMLDISEQCKPTRRGSCGSLDSGMSVSFHSDELHQQNPSNTAANYAPTSTINNAQTNGSNNSHSHHSHGAVAMVGPNNNCHNHHHGSLHHHQSSSCSNSSSGSSHK